jgi:hypothetical protein
MDQSRNLGPVKRLAVGLLVMTLAAACSESREAEVAALTDSLAPISTQINRSVAQLFDLLDDEFDNRAQLYGRILDLRLPTALAIELDKAQRVEPPPGSEPTLDRYLGFLGELLLASEALDLAIANQDPVEIAIAAVSMEVASGALAVALPASTCTALTPAPARDLCAMDGLDGYESELSFELRRFVASFRPAFRVPDTFGDVVRGRVLATLQADAALVLASTSQRFEGIDPGTSYGRLHQIIVDYFPAAAAAWGTFEADANASDPLIYQAIVDAVEAERDRTHRLLVAEYESVLAALPESQVAAIAEIWFGIEPDEVTEG